MRVPPDQSSTAPHHLRPTATSGSRLFSSARGARQARAEDEALDARFGVSERVREMQQHARIAAHRCPEMSASTTIGAGSGRGRRQRSSPELRRRGAPSSASVARQSTAAGANERSPRRVAQRLEQQRSLQSVRGVRRAISSALMVSKSALRSTSRSLTVNAASSYSSSSAVGLRRGRAAGWGNSASPRRRFSRCSGSALLRAHLGQQHRAHAAFEVGVAPEQLEGLVEQILVLDAVEHAGAEHGVEVASLLSKPASRSACSVSCTRSVPTAIPAAAQHAREVHTFSARWPGGVARRRRFVVKRVPSPCHRCERRKAAGARMRRRSDAGSPPFTRADRGLSHCACPVARGASDTGHRPSRRARCHRLQQIERRRRRAAHSSQQSRRA